MHDYKFLPSFEIGTTNDLDNLKHQYDVINFNKTTSLDRRLNLYMHELENYFTIIVNMKERIEDLEISHKAKMRWCTNEDFESRGVEVNEEFAAVIAKRICPDIAKNETLYKVRNVYTNQHLRNSFSIEIRKC